MTAYSDFLAMKVKDAIAMLESIQQMRRKADIFELIDAIRQREGASVKIHYPNPDFMSKAECVEVSLDYGQTTTTFCGNTLLDTLREAHKAVAAGLPCKQPGCERRDVHSHYVDGPATEVRVLSKRDDIVYILPGERCVHVGCDRIDPHSHGVEMGST
jgi:hypothetical protein